ncbi:MAG: DUF2490 domain-containing protein [Bacteroidales bacterium]|nr:DUF2490 domain-containing protein [Bacteroidales bacterium]
MLKKLFVAILLSGSAILVAQNKDFGAWYSLGGRYEITKKIQLNISEEFRTNSNAGSINQFFTELGLNYKLNKYFSIGGNYRFIKKREDDDQFYTRNRFYGDLEFKLPLKRFEFNYRFRFQKQKNKFAEYEIDLEPIFINRHKFELEYNIPGSKLTPSVFYERFFRTYTSKAYEAVSVRYGLGLSYKFNKKHAISAGYFVDKDLVPNVEYLRVLSFGYRFNLK